MTSVAFPDDRGPYELLADLCAQVAEIKRMVEKPRAADSAAGWLSVKSAAKYLDMSEEALRGVVKRRQLEPCRTPAGRLRFRRDELDAWVRGDA